MKELYHIILTAHSEVLLRNIDDVRMMTNLSALSAWRSDTDILTDSFMSTHIHFTVMSRNPDVFIRKLRFSITKAFNYKYHRAGRLFDPNPSAQKVQGTYHSQMTFNYSLRQGMHHGVSETPFAYPWSTCNYLFGSERGVTPDKPVFRTRSEVQACLSKNADFPDEWQADADGILVRPSFEQLKLVETWYGTARGYMFSMIRRTSAEWLEEQKKDNNDSPVVTLETLEYGYSNDDITQMLNNEKNSKYLHRNMPDMEICSLIDNQMLGRFGKTSVYELSARQKTLIADDLRYDPRICSEAQLSRCLVMKYHL